MERIVKRTQVPDYRAFSAIPSSLRIDPISTQGAIRYCATFWGERVKTVKSCERSPQCCKLKRRPTRFLVM